VTAPAIFVNNGVKIPVSQHMPESFLRSRLRRYEREEIEIVKAELGEDDIVMELGTGIGYLSTFCAKKIGSDRVFTYEANPALESDIRDVFNLNGVSPELNMCLLGHRTGTEVFHVADKFICSSTIMNEETNRSISVPLKLFNEEIRRVNPTFLIVDIEGGEYDLFMQADLFNVRKLLVELHGDAIGKDKIAAVIQRFAEQGFQPNEKVTRSALSVKRKAYLTAVGLFGAHNTNSIMSLFNLQAGSLLQESKFFER